MPQFHKVIMTNYIKREDGTGFDHHTATDVVGDDILDAYMTDAAVRWATVEDDGIVPAPPAYTVPDSLEN